MQLRVLLFPFHRTEIQVALNSSQSASGSHAANAAFAKAPPTVTPQGNTGGYYSLYQGYFSYSFET